MLCFFLFAFLFNWLCDFLYLDINLSLIYRYSVEKIPLYDSAEDELSQQTATSADFTYDEKDMMEVDHKINSTRMNVDSLVSVPANGVSSSIRPKKKLKRLPHSQKQKKHNKRFWHMRYKLHFDQHTMKTSIVALLLQQSISSLAKKLPNLFIQKWNKTWIFQNIKLNP